jgi:acetylornithine deacetylase/succinyl-diaminopimelate desuccinylase-like protein
VRSGVFVAPVFDAGARRRRSGQNPSAMATSPTAGARDARWREAIFELADLERPSASPGERRAAESIAARLQALGCSAEVEEEQVHGSYWWPLGLANLAAIAAVPLARGGRARRAGAALVAGLAAAALWDDLGHGRRWFRRPLPKRPTWNVLASTGDPAAGRTLVFVAHHDAAHSGLVFHPALGRIGPRLLPGLHERATQNLPILYGVWLGPVLVCAGACLRSRWLRRTGMAFAVGAATAMANIGMSSVVPGANDNLAAVGALLAIAEELRERPVEGLRVLLLSTGSEESFSEGMQAFGERHFSQLDRERTEVVCLECLGGPTLIVLEGEGMLRMRDYTPRMREALAAAAERAGVAITRGLRTVAASDALIALRAGYPTVTLASIDHTKLPLNYHWPSDRPEALHWRTIEDAIAVCVQLIRDRAPGARRVSPQLSA